MLGVHIGKTLSRAEWKLEGSLSMFLGTGIPSLFEFPSVYYLVCLFFLWLTRCRPLVGVW